MNKIDIKVLFEKKQEQMLSSFDLSSPISHPGTKGDATEAEWRKWFNTFFPKRYCAEKAFIIDSNGNCSEQIDVVIYDTHFSPTIFEMNGEKYIPAESVYAVFEVKQDLSKEHLEYAINKIKSVKSLIRTSAPINTINGYVNGRKPPIIIGGLLTLKSSWIDSNIEKNLIAYINELTNCLEEQIDFICCLSSYACAIEHAPPSPQQSKFYGQSIYISDIALITDDKNKPLIFTYFKLLRMLQDLGNVPAIEYDKYGIKGIDPKLL